MTTAWPSTRSGCAFVPTRDIHRGVRGWAGSRRKSLQLAGDVDTRRIFRGCRSAQHEGAAPTDRRHPRAVRTPSRPAHHRERHLRAFLAMTSARYTSSGASKKRITLMPTVHRATSQRKVRNSVRSGPPNSRDTTGPPRPGGPTVCHAFCLCVSEYVHRTTISTNNASALPSTKTTAHSIVGGIRAPVRRPGGTHILSRAV